MSFLDDEGSVEASRPREGIEIVLPTQTFRICTGTRSVRIGGVTYIAEPSARAALSIPREAGTRPVTEIRLPADHGFVAKYMSGTLPPRYVLANIYRLQLDSNTSECVWRGKIASVRFTDDVAVFSVPSRLLSVLSRRLPQFGIARTCQNVLYDANCQVDRASFKVSTTIANVNGNKITVASMSGNPDQWAQRGEIVHGPSGERLPIADQTGSVLTVQWPVVGWSNGQSVEVFAGCDQSIEMCNDKFSNRPRFLGSPYLNRETLRSPPGYGTYSSE